MNIIIVFMNITTSFIIIIKLLYLIFLVTLNIYILWKNICK